MRNLPVVCLLLFCMASGVVVQAQDSLRAELKKQIALSGHYDALKVQGIDKLKQALAATPERNHQQQYALNMQLYEEYKYYNYDSARRFADRLERFSDESPEVLINIRLKLIFIMLSSGMFKETLDSLNKLDMKYAPDSLKAEYYSLLGRCYYDLADFNSDKSHTPNYYQKANLYFDTALSILPRNSFNYSYYTALKYLKNGSAREAQTILENLISSRVLTYHEIALATSTIGGIYVSQGLEGQAKQYLMQASIADIRSSTKETYALHSLASIVYKEGRLEDAVLYIEKANKDASFYNTLFRKVQIGDILPLIEGEMITTIEDQKNKLVISLAVLAVFAVLIAAFAFIIRNQLRKLKVARKSLMEANVKLQEINGELVEANSIKERYNDQLQSINKQLSEANKIKEQYIGYYLGVDTDFMSRFLRFVNAIDKKVNERKWDEIRFLIRSIDLQKEKEEMLGNFDRIFLSLFPNFVEQFNTLFDEENRIILKEGQLLNAELRIFALIRLGITANEKIAEILNYSVNTIYAKKTKVRSRTIVNKDDFEKRLTEITTLSL